MMLWSFAFSDRQLMVPIHHPWKISPPSVIPRKGRTASFLTMWSRNPSWFRVRIPNTSEYTSDPNLISEFELEDAIKQSNGRVYIHSLRFDRSVGVKSKLWTKSPELTLTLIWKCQSSHSLALGHLLATSDIYAGKASFPRRVLGQWSNVNLKIDWRIFFFYLYEKYFGSKTKALPFLVVVL